MNKKIKSFLNMNEKLTTTVRRKHVQWLILSYVCKQWYIQFKYMYNSALDFKSHMAKSHWIVVTEINEISDTFCIPVWIDHIMYFLSLWVCPLHWWKSCEVNLFIIFLSIIIKAQILHNLYYHINFEWTSTLIWFQT